MWFHTEAYCAICGGVPGVHGDHKFRRFLNPPPLGELHTEAELEWLGDMRIIGANPPESSRARVYFSGPARYKGQRIFEVVPGEDPNFPSSQEVKYINGLAQIAVYDKEHILDLAIPLHNACLRVLQEVLYKRGLCGFNVDINFQILYQTLMSLSSRVHEREDLPGFNSQLRYGDAAGILQDAYYGCESDPFRLSFINPSYNSPFKSYFQQPPLLQFGEMGTSHFRPHAKDEVLHKDDRLSRLPPEILYLIMRHMDLDDIEAFRMASRAAARLELTGGFWKDKLLSDMEWMQYPCSLSPNTRHAGIDWRQVYLDMGANTPAGPYYRSHIGFMNRRRVWELCQKIASSFEVQLKCHEENPKRSPVLLRAIHTPMLTLASPKRSTFRTDAIVFENDLSSLGQNPRSLSTFWSLEGFLTGFGISEKGEDPIDQIKKCGDVSQSDTHVIVRIEPGDWIVGFILYLAQTDEESQGRMIVGLHVLFPSGTTSLHGSKKGDRKLLRTAGSRLIVGVQIETLQDRQVSALSLLLVPGSEASEYAVKLGERQRSVIGFRANRRFWYHFSKLLF